MDIHTTDSATNHHCRCNPGWTGVSCDVAFHACDGTTHKCYHGGECVLGLIDKYDNEQLYCNCDNAVDDDGTQWVGKYCEQTSMVQCDAINPGRFCLNGGQCNDEYPSAGKSCICAEGFEGSHCEYVADTVPDCDLTCRNGGHCKLGIPAAVGPDYFGVGDQAEDAMQYCECPDGYHGVNCEIETEACGDGQCFHGSKCVSAIVNGETLHHCDCRFANTESKSFAGLYCQYEANEYCDKSAGGLNGHLFCVNGGQCQPDAYQGCICPDDYRGFSCEYYIGTANTENAPPPDEIHETTCTLDCNGRGTCRDGIKETPSGDTVGHADHLIDDAAMSSENFEHCVCEPGWTGLQCEVKAEKCDGGEYHCFHGSECYKAGDEQKCDCSTANSAELGTSTFAGDQCEHPATEICTEEGSGSDTNPSEVGVGLSFCVNYGTCKAKVKAGEAHPGCDCDEEKWTGPHCEIKIAQPEAVPPTTSLTQDDDNDDRSAGEVFKSILAVVAVVLAVGIIIYTIMQCLKGKRARRQRSLKNGIQWDSSRGLNGGYKDEPAQPEVNLSPRRESRMSQDMTPLSSRDPFAAHLASPELAASLPLNDAGDSGPQVYLGPPQDEDGHVLHSVEIL